MNERAIRKLVRAALSEPDERQCAECLTDVHTDEGLEPTPLCHCCAQRYSRVFALVIDALLPIVRAANVHTDDGTEGPVALSQALRAFRKARMPA